VILLGDKKRLSISAAAIPSTNDRPSKKLRFDVNAKTDEKKKASRKSVMQAATMPSTKDDRPAKRPRINGIAKTDKKTDAKSKSNTISLKVLSWNIAECRPSHDAPAVSRCEQAILREMLSHEAHILCLQESPSASWTPACLQQTYDCVGASESHCGFTQLWIHKNLFYQHLESKGLSVAAIVLVGNQPLGISSSHLAPSKENASSRLKQVTNLVQCFSATPNFVIVDDFNMRQAEDKAMGGLGLQNVFKVAGCPQTANFTWNSHQNK
jgi:endonuclease/exonuclease/phosphatase family metal-dependent hydrolase